MSVPRCGSITVDLALKFNSITKEQDVIITLSDAVKEGKLGEFSVGAIKGKRPCLMMTSTTSPNLSTNRTLYASYVRTFVVHFVR